MIGAAHRNAVWLLYYFGPGLVQLLEVRPSVVFQKKCSEIDEMFS